MNKVLVIGASGFVGGKVARALCADGYAVRCLARTPSRIQKLAEAECEVVQGDMSDPVSVQQAIEGVEAVYISVHTLSPQSADTAGQGFMEVEMNGLGNIVTACRTQGARRLIYITSLGIAPDAPGEWLRERWKTEQFLLDSGLDVTVIQPGMIVGVGGRGFDTMVDQAGKPVSVNLLGAGDSTMRSIAIDDLVYYLVGVLNDPRAYGQRYNVGSDDILTNNQKLDVIAELLGRSHPRKVNLPRVFLSALAPLIERMGKLPNGAMKGLLDSLDGEAMGDPLSIRAILPRPLLSFRQAVERALDNAK